MQGVTSKKGNNREEIFSAAEMDRLLEELNLSPKQADIIRCLFTGCSDKQIASRMQIQMPTVRTHISRLFQKFDVDDREGLILHVFSHFRSGCRGAVCPRKQ